MRNPEQKMTPDLAGENGVEARNKVQDKEVKQISVYQGALKDKMMRAEAKRRKK